MESGRWGGGGRDRWKKINRVSTCYVSIDDESILTNQPRSAPSTPPSPLPPRSLDRKTSLFDLYGQSDENLHNLFYKKHLPFGMMFEILVCTPHGHERITFVWLR